MKIECEIKCNLLAYKLCIFNLLILRILNIITLGFIKDRLLFQAEKVIDVYIKSITINFKECP